MPSIVVSLKPPTCAFVKAVRNVWHMYADPDDLIDVMWIVIFYLKMRRKRAFTAIAEAAVKKAKLLPLTIASWNI